MKDTEKYASLKNTTFGKKLIFWIIATFVTIAIIFTLLLYPIRNSKSHDVAIRFLKNNEIIKSEVDEITKIIGFGLGGSLGLPDRSKEIAQNLKNKEQLSNINTSKETDNSEFLLTSDGYGSWQTGKLIGSKKTIEVRLYLRKNEFGDFGNTFHYTVTEAKYRDENGDWKNISIGWLENYFLLFK
jgi:hypothetical protein